MLDLCTVSALRDSPVTAAVANLSTNVSVSGLRHEACACWWTNVSLLQQKAVCHRMHGGSQVRSSLVSLAGGTASLPITDPAARATPLAPSQWRTMLRDAVPLHGSPVSGAAQGTDSAAAHAAHSSSNTRPDLASELAETAHRSGNCDAGTEPQQPGYSSRPPLGPDGAPSSSGASSGQSWRSLGRSSAPNAASTSDAPASPYASLSASQIPAARAAYEVAAAPSGDAQRRGVVVLDVRNGYEWDAGHFVGAERPAEVRMP